MHVHDERHGDLGPVYTLDGLTLRRQSRGAMGGGVNDSIPVHAIEGFFAATYDMVRLGGEKVSEMSQFIFRWRQGNEPRRETWTVNVRSATFQALLNELGRLRPDADLRKLPHTEAQKRLGGTNLNAVWWIVGAVALAGVSLVAALVYFVLLAR